MARRQVGVFTDASFCHMTKAAAWACWMKAQGEAVTQARPFKTQVICPSHAELMAIACALTWGKKSGFLEDGDLIFLQSDSMDALRQLRHYVPGAVDRPFKYGLSVPITPTSIPHLNQEVIQEIVKLFSDNDWVLLMRHIKGHGNNQSPRSWVNNKVDELAYEQMNKVRASHFSDKLKRLRQ